MGGVKSKSNISYYNDLHTGSQAVKQAEGLIEKLLKKA